MELTYEAIAKRIDHSLLGADADRRRTRRGLPARRAVRGGERLHQAVRGAARGRDPRRAGVSSGRRSASPTAGHATAVKVFEAERAMDDGATELDMVVNIGQAIGGRLGRGPGRHRRGDRGRPRRRGDRQGDLRELLPERRPEDPALPDLRRGRAPTTSRPRPATAPAGRPHADLILMRQGSPASRQAQGRRRGPRPRRGDRRGRTRLRPDRGEQDGRDPRRADGPARAR